MTKQLVVSIGFENYTGSAADLIALADIATRLRRVKRAPHYSDGYLFDAGDPFVQRIEIEDVREPEPEPEPAIAEPIEPPPPAPATWGAPKAGDDNIPF